MEVGNGAIFSSYVLKGDVNFESNSLLEMGKLVEQHIKQVPLRYT